LLCCSCYPGPLPHSKFSTQTDQALIWHRSRLICWGIDNSAKPSRSRHHTLLGTPPSGTTCLRDYKPELHGPCDAHRNHHSPCVPATHWNSCRRDSKPEQLCHPGVKRDHSLGRRDPRSLDEAVSRICLRDTKPPHGPCLLFAHRNFPLTLLVYGTINRNPPLDAGRRLHWIIFHCRHTFPFPPFASFAVVAHHRRILTCIHPAGKYDPVASSTLDSPCSRRRLDRRCVFLRPVGFLLEVVMLVSLVDFWFQGELVYLLVSSCSLRESVEAWRYVSKLGELTDQLWGREYIT